MNKWMKKKKVALAVMTLTIGLGVSAMAPFPKSSAEDINNMKSGGSTVVNASIFTGIFETVTSSRTNLQLDEGIKFTAAAALAAVNNSVLNDDLQTSLLSVNHQAKSVAGEPNTTEAAIKDVQEPAKAQGNGEEDETLQPDQKEPVTKELTDHKEEPDAEGEKQDIEEPTTEEEKEAPAPDILNEGIEHSIVAELQQRLMDLGFMDYAEPTKFFGSITKSAVMLFQRQNGLKQDGIVGPETLASIMSPDCKRYTISIGIEGDDVHRLQSRLYETGYLPNADMVTGYFGDVTEAAVKKMQEVNGLAVDGMVGVETLNLLYSEELKPNILSFGESSEIVKACQTRLKELGYLTTTPDGVYGNDTGLAVKQFQSRNDLVIDGFLGPTTLQVLNSENANPNGLSLGDRNENVNRVQELLSKYGYLSESNITGYFGEITEQAVKALQKNNGLTADGNVGMRTMAVLTGSDVKRASSETSGSQGGSSSSSDKNNQSTGDNKNSGSSGSSNGSSGSSNGSSESGKDKNNSSSESNESSGNTAPGSSVSALIQVAKSKLGSPYVLGAKGPNAFDCSGFIYWCLNQVGVRQSYTTSYGWRSMNKYHKVSNFSDIRAGDIIVVTGHVGIAAGGGMVVDASSSSGKIVYRELGSWWKQRFIVAWRIF